MTTAFLITTALMFVLSAYASAESLIKNEYDQTKPKSRPVLDVATLMISLFMVTWALFCLFGG